MVGFILTTSLRTQTWSSSPAPTARAFIIPDLGYDSGRASLLRVKLTVYDTVESPSPLRAKRYEIDVNVKTGILEIKETLLVSNPTLTTFIGEASKDASPTTLALSIPDGFERVTFDQEFYGRQFRLANGHVVTDLPWPPGQRRLVFSYQLPADKDQRTLERLLDLPCDQVRLRVSGENTGQVRCNLPRVSASTPSPIIFESSGQTLTAGDMVRLEFGSLSVPWIVTGRWMALALLGTLVVVTTLRTPFPHRAPPKSHSHLRRLAKP